MEKTDGPAASAKSLAHRAVLVMGVSASGKTTVGREVARRIEWTFVEADTYHSPENVEKMRKGIPLTDADREPWLRTINGLLRESTVPKVLACSALRSSYREILGASVTLAIFHLKGTYEELFPRMNRRTGHFMPPSLLKSQLATLEDPVDAVTLPVTAPAEENIATIVRHLGERGWL